MKDCAYYQELISRLVDREITPEEGEELEEKDAEEGEGLVIRAVETNGRPARARISLPFAKAANSASSSRL